MMGENKMDVKAMGAIRGYVCWVVLVGIDRGLVHSELMVWGHAAEDTRNVEELNYEHNLVQVANKAGAEYTVDVGAVHSVDADGTVHGVDVVGDEQSVAAAGAVQTVDNVGDVHSVEAVGAVQSVEVVGFVHSVGVVEIEDHIEVLDDVQDIRDTDGYHAGWVTWKVFLFEELRLEKALVFQECSLPRL